ncbi:MAG: MmgE/PrpD family protein [Acidobacteriota bacterium]
MSDKLKSNESKISRRTLLQTTGGALSAMMLNHSSFAGDLSIASQQVIVATLQETSQSVASVWADAIHNIRYADLAPEIIKRAKLCLLDCIGVMAHTATLKDSRTYLERPLAIGGAHEATVWGFNVKLPLETAAACNAFLIHGNEIDDSDFRSNYRPSCVSVAPPLTVAEFAHASGRDLILATAIAYTVNGLLAAKLDRLQGLGFMPSSVVGPGGAAAATAKLLKFDKEKTEWALTLGIASGGGLFQYYFDQTEEKKLHVARAVRTGIECALIAQKGWQGPAHIVEGAAGMMPSYLRGTGRKVDYQGLKNDIAKFDGAMFVVPKFSSCSASITPFIDALAPVYQREKIQAAEIEKFIIVNDWLADSSFVQKILHFEPPPTIVGAQLNMNFSISLFLNRGSASVDDFVDASLKDKAVLNLAARAGHETVAPGKEWETRLVMRDGRVIRAPFRRSIGERYEPEMLERRMEKFQMLTRKRLSPTAQKAVVRLVEQVDSFKDIAGWTQNIHRLFKKS